VGFGSVALVAMLTLTGLLLKQQQAFLNDFGIRRAHALAHGLAQSSPSWVLANDLVGLEEIFQGYRNTPDLERIFILSPSGEVLASTNAQEIGRFANDPISLDLLKHKPESHVLVFSDNLIDVVAPVLTDERHIGWARVELNQNETRVNLKTVASTMLQFAVMTSMLLIALSIWLGRRMSKRLQALDSVAKHIASGKRTLRAQTGQNDEIGRLAGNINYMLDTLTQSERDLGQLNRVYAAWTECVAMVGRESRETILLNRLCQILATTIGFRLVFIGFTDAKNDWIDIVASSDWGSSYLKKLKVSVRMDRPEGHGPIGLAIRKGQPQIFNDFLAEAGTSPWHASAEAEAIRAACAFPLSRGGRVVAGLAVYSDQVGYFNDSIISLLHGLSDDISFALDNIDLENLRLQTETELRLAASVFENSQEGIMITDAEKTILRVNANFCRITGYTAEEVIGGHPKMLSSGLQDRVFYQNLWEQVLSQGFWQGEIVNRRKNGEIFPEWLCITRVQNAAAEVTHYVGTFMDITDRKLDEERIHKLAFYDPLTQLPNRRLLIERLRQALLESQRSKAYGAVMFMDLDRFKILNDTQGHDKGDQLLIEVGKRITDCVREQDTVARLGGDEFVVMLEDLGNDHSQAALIAQRIGNKLLTALHQPYQLHCSESSMPAASITHHSSASIGMTLFRGLAVNCEDLLKQADVAMYQAKQAGRNTFCAFSPDMQAHIDQRATLEVELRQALSLKQFCLYYQIQVDAQGHAIGAEVLLRWNHPQRGLISPAAFISLAEESGLIDELGLWTLQESCKTLVNWAQRPETRELSLAVNVSAKQFNQNLFVSQIRHLLDIYAIAPQRLKLEITESLVLDNVDEAIAIMGELRALGVNFSMDDFGTGYSSLSYLQRLPLSQLKIDQSFVRDLTTDNHDAAIIRTILNLGGSLAMDVVAEGVENEQQRDYLLANGCQYFQGFLFGKPQPLAEFEQRLVSHYDIK
jgi:diguanylate cyclase (GGDEF)-like protein/PAS domain S-box-containing protein